MCARTCWDEDANPIGDMPMELFERIAPYLKKANLVSLQIFGEPLLVKSFYEMIVRCKAADCDIVFNTNGTLFNGNNCRKIIESGVDTVGVSIDGTTSLEEIRGVKLERLKRNIKTMNAVKRELDSDKPQLSIAFVAMIKNLPELPEVVELAAELEMGGVYVSPVVIHTEKLLDQNIHDDVKTTKIYFAKAQEAAVQLDISLTLPHLGRKVNFCKQPFESIWVNWNGDVRPCCASPNNEDGSLKAGNLCESSLKEIWNNEFMRNLRMALLAKKTMPMFCQRCHYRDNRPENYVKILERHVFNGKSTDL